LNGGGQKKKTELQRGKKAGRKEKSIEALK